MNTSPEKESPKANFASLFRTIVKETFTLDNVNYDKSLRIVNQCPWTCSEDDLLYNDDEKNGHHTHCTGTMEEANI